jgi:hypothetical protein
MPPPPSAAAASTKTNNDKNGAVSHVWEVGQNMWENAVQEDADGRIVVAGTEDTLAVQIRKRRKRLEQADFSQRNLRVVRDMIRYVYVLVGTCSSYFYSRL